MHPFKKNEARFTTMHGNLSFGQIGETSLLAAWLGQIRPTLHFPSEHGLLQKCGIKSARANPNKAQYTPVIRLDKFKNLNGTQLLFLIMAADLSSIDSLLS